MPAWIWRWRDNITCAYVIKVSNSICFLLLLLLLCVQGTSTWRHRASTTTSTALSQTCHTSSTGDQLLRDNKSQPDTCWSFLAGAPYCRHVTAAPIKQLIACRLPHQMHKSLCSFPFCLYHPCLFSVSSICVVKSTMATTTAMVSAMRCDAQWSSLSFGSQFPTRNRPSLGLEGRMEGKIAGKDNTISCTAVGFLLHTPWCACSHDVGRGISVQKL